MDTINEIAFCAFAAAWIMVIGKVAWSVFTDPPEREERNPGDW